MAPVTSAGMPSHQRTPLRGARYLGIRGEVFVEDLHRVEPRVLDLLVPDHLQYEL